MPSSSDIYEFLAWHYCFSNHYLTFPNPRNIVIARKCTHANESFLYLKFSVINNLYRSIISVVNYNSNTTKIMCHNLGKNVDLTRKKHWQQMLLMQPSVSAFSLPLVKSAFIDVPSTVISVPAAIWPTRRFFQVNCFAVLRLVAG